MSSDNLPLPARDDPATVPHLEPTEPRLVFIVDENAPPGDVVAALARLLIHLVECNRVDNGEK